MVRRVAERNLAAACLLRAHLNQEMVCRCAAARRTHSAELLGGGKSSHLEAFVPIAIVLWCSVAGTPPTPGRSSVAGVRRRQDLPRRCWPVAALTAFGAPTFPTRLLLRCKEFHFSGQKCHGGLHRLLRAVRRLRVLVLDLLDWARAVGLVARTLTLVLVMSGDNG